MHAWSLMGVGTNANGCASDDSRTFGEGMPTNGFDGASHPAPTLGTSVDKRSRHPR